MKTTEIFILCMVMAVVSFLGFVVENVWLAFTKGYIDNRNMCFPFLIGYGIAILLIFVLLGTPEKLGLIGKLIPARSRKVKVMVFFFGAMLCVSVGEILLGTFVEKVCHFCWWNYSELPLHITKYTSVPTSMMFALLITVFMDRFFEPLYSFFGRWSGQQLGITASVLCTLMTGDFIYNAIKMYRTQGLLQRWKIQISGSGRRIHRTSFGQ